jgi:hypothetical protein
VRLRLRSGARGSRWLLTSLTIAILETHSLSLNVTAASFDFALANGGNRSVTRGASVSNPVTATHTAGSTRAVTFTASGLPAGAQATFSTSSCSPTCSTTVTISTAGSTPLTTSTITITATAGGRVRRTTFALTVTADTDTVAPTVALSAPANNAFVAGTAVAVSATASDNAAVAGVQFLLDGANLGTEDTAAPYSVTWNTTTASDGPHVLSSRARDGSGNTATAASVNVVVDNQAPAGTVAINDGAPSTNTTTVALTLTATDAVSTVTQMRFSNSGVSYSSPEAYGPSKTWTLSPGSGTKTVYAQFKDAAGNWSAAATDTIVVEAAPDTAPPSVAITSPPDSATVAGTVTISASAQDDVAVAGVQFQIDGANAGAEVNTAPFTTSIDTTTLPDGNHVLTAIARDTSNNTATSAPVSVTVNNAAPSIPTLIQHVTTSSNYDPSELGNNFRIHLADPALASNCVILGIRYPDAPGRTVTIADDRGNAWLTGPTVSNNGIRSRIFYVTGVIAGTRDIIVTFDAKLSGFQAQISEFYNVAVNFALDGSSGSATSPNPAIAAGSLTTTVPGDLVYNYVTTNDFGATITSITAGAGFTLLSADRLRASAAQYTVRTQAGAVNPAMTVASASGTMNSLAIALKGAAAGTPPAPGIRVTHVYHGYWLGSPAKLQFPSTGNLLVLATSFGTGNSNISSIASTPGNTWTKVTLPPVDTTDPQMLYAANAVTGPNLEFAINASAAFLQFVIYDVTGAATVPFDSAAKASGNNASNGPILGAPQISSTGRGLIIATLPMGHGPPVNCTTAGCLFDGVTYPGEADGSTFESSDGYAHLYNSTAGWTSFDWQPASVQLPSAWFALAVAFKSP